MDMSDYKEAYTRLIIHLQDAFLNGFSNCIVHTADTDVVVILIGKFQNLMTLSTDLRIWVAFGTGFTVILYDENCKLDNVNEACQ